MAQKDVGEMKRAAGFQNEFWNRMADKLVARNGCADQLYGASNQTLDAAAEAAVAVFVGNDSSSAGTIVASFELTVDHGRSVKRMVNAGGYTEANPNITDAHFPHPRKGVETVTIDLVKFDQMGTTAERERQLEPYGELAEMDDQLAFGEQYRDEQRKRLIVFLGSAWVHPDGSRHVGCLDGDAQSRFCLLYWGPPEYRWYPGCVFAVCRRK